MELTLQNDIAFTPPAVYIFDDWIETISTGGLPLDFSIEEFFAGISHPINLNLKKSWDSLVWWNKSAMASLIYLQGMRQTSCEGLSQNQSRVLKTIKDNPAFSIAQIGGMVGLGRSRVSEVIAELKELKRPERVGGKKADIGELKKSRHIKRI